MGNNKIVILLLLVFLACKKPASYEPSEPVKYEPLPYFPVFPGSYWEYVDTSFVIIKLITEPAYQSLKLKYTDSIILDPILVPVYNGQSILKYNKISYSNFYYQPNIILKPFFSEKLNDQFSNVESGINHHTEYRIEKKYRVMAINQSMNHPHLGIIDSIVVIDQKTSYDYVGYDYATHELSYYAKNIGIIRNSLINDSIGDTTVILDLKTYFINR